MSSAVAAAANQASTGVYNIGLSVQNQLFYDKFIKKEFEAKGDYFKFTKNTAGIPAQITNAGTRYAGPTYSEQLKSLGEQTSGAISEISNGLQEHVNDVQKWSQDNQTRIGNAWQIGHAAGGLIGGAIGAAIAWGQPTPALKKDVSFTPVSVNQNTGYQGGKSVDPNTVGSHNYIQNVQNNVNAGLGYYAQTGKDIRATGGLLNSQTFSNTSPMTPNYGKGATIYNSMEAKSISPAGALDLIQMHPGDNSVPSYPVGSSDGQTTLSQAQSSPTSGVNPIRGGTAITQADVHFPDNFDVGKTAIASVPYTDDVREAKLVQTGFTNSGGAAEALDGANGGPGHQATTAAVSLKPYTDDVREAKLVKTGFANAGDASEALDGANGGPGYQATTATVPGETQ